MTSVFAGVESGHPICGAADTIQPTGGQMTRREEWQAILNAEVKRWSLMSCDEVLDELRVREVYEITDGSKRYQVEALLLENTPEYLHVSISVDDGSLPASLHPASQGVICQKEDPSSSQTNV